MSPSTSRLQRKRSASCLRQTVIDAGQKKIGLQHCVQCGMVYCVDERADLQQHEAYHNRFTTTDAFRINPRQLTRWKEKLFHEEVTSPSKGLLFHLNGESNVSLRAKFQEVVKDFVNEELGYCPDLPVWDASGKRQALVFICAQEPKSKRSRGSMFISGLVLIDKVQRVTLMPQQRVFQGEFLGVNRIWIHAKLRRSGLATFLLDSARRLLVTGGVLPRSRIAFSEPTEAGIRLATAYLNNASKRSQVEDGEDKENIGPETPERRLSRHLSYLIYGLHEGEDGSSTGAKRVSLAA